MSGLPRVANPEPGTPPHAVKKHVGTRTLILLSQAPGPIGVTELCTELGVSRMSIHKMLEYWRIYDYFTEQKFPCERCKRDERYLTLTASGERFAAKCIDRYGSDWR